MFVFLDRAMLYYHYVSNWAHAHRGSPDSLTGRTALTTRWSESQRTLFIQYMQALQKNRSSRLERLHPKVLAALNEAVLAAG